MQIYTKCTPRRLLWRSTFSFGLNLFNFYILNEDLYFHKHSNLMQSFRACISMNVRMLCIILLPWHLCKISNLIQSFSYCNMRHIIFREAHLRHPSSLADIFHFSIASYYDTVICGWFSSDTHSCDLFIVLIAEYQLSSLVTLSTVVYCIIQRELVNIPSNISPIS